MDSVSMNSSVLQQIVRDVVKTRESSEVFIIPRRFLEDSSGILTIPEDFQD